MRRSGPIALVAAPARAAALWVAISVALGVGASDSAAAELSFSFETQVPADGLLGSDAGQLDEPRGVAFNPVNRHLYVAEMENRRISEFTAWGEFVKAFGWGVRDGSAEAQTCTAETGCQKGLTGSGPGQFGAGGGSQNKSPTGIAVDSNGDIYAMDLGNFRVQKFDAEGDFLLTFGGEVNETTGEDVCTAASGDTCVAGVPGTGPGEFSVENVIGVTGDYLDVAPDDTVYVGDKGRIQAFDTGGAHEASLPLPASALENPGSLAIDPVSGDVYFAFNQGFVASQDPKVYRLDEESGDQVGVPLTLDKPTALAVDPGGSLYVANQPPPFAPTAVLKFNPAGAELGQFGEADFASGMTLFGLGTGEVSAAGDLDLYVSRTQVIAKTIGAYRVYGAVPDPDLVGPPPAVPPTIAGQFASTVLTDSATLHAEINPHFWDDTTFYLEYGTEPCDGEGEPCVAKPAPPGQALTAKVTNEPVRSAGILLRDLAPNTTYHYRFVAESGGGPTVGTDTTFTTPPLPGEPSTDCPNQRFRTGAGAFLPDCRAYEMVSPVDKNESDIVTLSNSANEPAALDQATPEGERLTYSAHKAFAGAVASPYSSQYMATRGGAGWANRSISPPRSGPTLLELSGLDVQFKAFGPELCNGWFLQDTVGELDPPAVDGYPNLYRADLCAESTGYEAITRIKPAARPPSGYLFEVQGVGDGHTVFRANDKLTADAPAGEAAKVYAYLEGALDYVCVLPNGTAWAGGCSVGTAGGDIPAERRGNAEGAVSADGARIYWTADDGGSGKLYLRTGGSQTIAVSKGDARFWGAAPDGARAVFTEAGALYEFEAGVAAPEAGELIAAGVLGLAGISEDASRVYFASTEDLDGGGEAEAGKPNLYLRDDGAFAFIAVLSDLDVDTSNKFLSNVAAQPSLRAARVTPDGGALAFISNNELTGQDSKEVNSGNPVSQVYLYDAGEEELRCVSCNRTGARPLGRDTIAGTQDFWASALLPTWASQLYRSRALSTDGRRLFFNSFDALVPRDTNKAMDVYQWEAPGKGDCADPEGCVSLISSGQSPEDSEFIDAAEDGSDVFFATQSSLVAQDPGLIDIYDARIGGGFPAPGPPPAECQGESCQSPEPAPQAPTPASAAFAGAGNLSSPIPRCAPRARQARRMARRAKRLRRKAKTAKAPRATRRLRRGAVRAAKQAKRKSKAARRCRARARRAK